ncbi:hypothetical protein [Novosphingobium sp. CECT 9465]|uniref:hypothetical protein n=1 Tax=Novosphingobium sp. CECT 9465 TaxID=2829794 RepID=UPI001E61EF3F|nr:hypothetical protein [Novosphingobium sp. CECT 9465]CAH0496520.1 hypothetical protein NVSP9465_01555 [Novosphingobium sp. CECT 9465]
MFSLRQVTDTDGYQTSPRSRVASFVLALVTSALVFVIMIRMGAFTQFGEPGGARLVAIDLGTEAEQGAKDSAQPEKAEQKSDSATAMPQTAPVVPPRVPIPGKVQWPEGFIELSSKDYAAADITKMKRGSGSGDAGSAGGSAGGEGAGEGPGGVRLYNAQWYREPTDAEMAPYMPRNRMPGEWAMIACRTIEKYHVEDCQELGESPPGSGLARALRQASWQFLVRPPRVNGKSQVGEWVRIRFDFRAPKKRESENDG